MWLGLQVGRQWAGAGQEAVGRTLKGGCGFARTWGQGTSQALGFQRGQLGLEDTQREGRDRPGDFCGVRGSHEGPCPRWAAEGLGSWEGGWERDRGLGRAHREVGSQAMGGNPCPSRL